MQKTVRHIGLAVFPDFQILDLAALTPFEMANREGQGDLYAVSLLSETGGSIRSSCGVAVETLRFGRQNLDTLLVAGSDTLPTPGDGLKRFVGRAVAKYRRVAGICTGAFVLADAGLLDGRRATTHWSAALELQRRHPAIRVEEDQIFIRDGTLWTSAGMTACLDLALALLEEDQGADIARSVARKLVIYHRRSGGQSQFSAMQDLAPRSDRVQTALSYARKNLHRPLSVDQLAEVVHLSPRQFSRVFQMETGHSPARAVEKLRIEAARLLLESGSDSVEQVARRTGFADPERMRRAFNRALGHPPQHLRRHRSRQTAASI